MATKPPRAVIAAIAVSGVIALFVAVLVGGAVVRSLRSGADQPRSTGPRRLASDTLGRARGRFAFDPQVADRVVTCEEESRDGGRTWRPLIEDEARRPMILGGEQRLAPIAGTSGRMLCADLILAGETGASGLGDVEAVAEWTGAAWQSLGLRAGSGALPGLSHAIFYAAGGSAAVIRKDRLRVGAGDVELPGQARAFAQSPGGVSYGAFKTADDEGALMWTPDPGAPWTPVQAPGAVRLVAAAGEHAYVAAGMFGRGQRSAWEWTHWPRDLHADGLAALGDRVVVWGYPGHEFRIGGVVASRNRGATLEFVVPPIKLTFAAIDPHHGGQLLAIGSDGTLLRLRLD